MTYDIYQRINNDLNLKRFLRENSNWYKSLNRNSSSFSYFVEEMKVKYKLTTSDKINKTMENMNIIQSFLDVLKQVVYNFFRVTLIMNEIMEKTYELIDVLECSDVIGDLVFYRDRIIDNRELQSLICEGNFNVDSYMKMDIKGWKLNPHVWGVPTKQTKKETMMQQLSKFEKVLCS